MKLRGLQRTLKSGDAKTVGLALIAFPEPTGISDILGLALIAVSTFIPKKVEVLKWKRPFFGRRCISMLESEANASVDWFKWVMAVRGNASLQ